jgi:long-chain fatty acid transport protein
MRIPWIRIALLASFAPLAMASGYGIYEQDAEATAQAGAVIARADNASANFYNPAGLATQDSCSVSVGGTWIHLDANAWLDKPLYLVDRSGPVPTVYRAYAAGDHSDMRTRNLFPMNLFANMKLKKNMAIGVGVFAPFGLNTQWLSPTSPMRYMSTNTDIKVIDLSGSFAMSHFDGKFAWSIGFDYYRGSATLDQVFDLGQRSANLPSPPFPPGITAVKFPRGDNTVHLEADGTKWGGHVGLQFSPTKDVKIGLVYRTKAVIDITGSARFTLQPALAAGPAVPGGAQYLSYWFPDQAASTSLPVPATGGVGISWKAGKKWEFEVDGSYQGWSALKSLDIDFSQETCLNPAAATCTAVLADRHIRENWSNTWAGRFGTKWQGWEKTYLAAGVVYDQNPIPADTLRNLLPDGDRLGITAGVGWRYKHLKFDVSAMDLFFQKRHSNPPQAIGQPVGVTEHETQETLAATYHGSALLFGFNLGWVFGH